MGYERTTAQKQNDLLAARPFEQEVRSRLGLVVRDMTSGTDDLDFWLPGDRGLFVDVKERRQPLGKRWHLLEGVPEEHLFVLDELSVRRACRHWPAAWFLIRDVPGGRLFLAWVVDVVCVERKRVQRVGKAKLVVDLRNFQMLQSLDDLVPAMNADMESARWKQSGAVGYSEIPQV